MFEFLIFWKWAKKPVKTEDEVIADLKQQVKEYEAIVGMTKVEPVEETLDKSEVCLRFLQDLGVFTSRYIKYGETVILLQNGNSKQVCKIRRCEIDGEFFLLINNRDVAKWYINEKTLKITGKYLIYNPDALIKFAIDNTVKESIIEKARRDKYIKINEQENLKKVMENLGSFGD